MDHMGVVWGIFALFSVLYMGYGLVLFRRAQKAEEDAVRRAMITLERKARSHNRKTLRRY
jgi:hypothetical protein